jgi:hypothetical protein
MIKHMLNLPHLVWEKGKKEKKNIAIKKEYKERILVLHCPALHLCKAVVARTGIKIEILPMVRMVRKRMRVRVSLKITRNKSYNRMTYGCIWL